MTVVRDDSRKTVAIKFDGVTGETFTIRAVNAEKEDVHSSGPHDLEINEDGWGSFTLTYPGDFTGTSNVEVTGSDGSRAEGAISVA